MAVERYFGLPGCGKTTTLTMLCIRAIRSGKYKHVYCNVELKVHGVTYVPFECFAVYELRECFFAIDEGMVEMGDREHKTFGKERLKEFVKHRHKYMDIAIFSQEADGIDKKVRSITDRMYYVKKGVITGHWITSIYRIPYDVMFPGTEGSGDSLGAIVMGYKKPSLLSRIFAQRIYRPKYYPYFDSWEADELPPLPAKYKPYHDPNHKDPVFRWYCIKSIILLRSVRKVRRGNKACFSRTLPKKRPLRQLLPAPVLAMFKP